MTTNFKKTEKRRLLIGEAIGQNAPERIQHHIAMKLNGSFPKLKLNGLNEEILEEIPEEVLLKSKPVSLFGPWIEFKTLVCDYINSHDNISLGNGDDKIKGFNLDASDMLSLIDPQTYNPFPFPLPASVVKVDRIIALVGLRNGAATLVYARVDNNGYILEDFALEYCDPCPSNCPKQIDDRTICA